MSRFKILLCTVLALFSCVQGSDSNPEAKLQKEASEKADAARLANEVYRRDQDSWVSLIFQQMSLDEKIGQLFMVAAYSNKNEAHHKEILNLIEKQNIGGLIFFQGGPVRQAVLTNRYQAKAKLPLLIAMDAEWGLGMRLDKDSVISFPKQMTLGAIQDNQFIYTMGHEIASQLKRLGVHVNFAPVADVNSNPKNPVIGMRSFGENKENVAQKAISYMKGMQENQVMANAKHFPGHGDTDTDSHLSLPVIKHGAKRLNDIELYPFKKLIADSVMSIMVAHVHVPAIDSTKNLATTLSPKAVKNLLLDSMGFKGLVFTDALNMQGVAKFYAPGETDLKALLAGNDVLLFPLDVAKGIAAIKKALQDGQITEAEIGTKVKKILAAKYFAGLNKISPVKYENLYEDLNNSMALVLKSELYKQSATVVKNKDKMLPFQNLDSLSFASVSLGIGAKNEFQATLSNYARFEHFNLPNYYAPTKDYDRIFDRVKDKKVVIVSLHKLASKPDKQYGISNFALNFIKKLQEKTKVVVCVFGNPYSLQYFDATDYLTCGYEDDPMMLEAMPQVLFGAISNRAKLPVTASPSMPEGMGFLTPFMNRMGYSLPEKVGMNSAVLNSIDSVANAMIKAGVAPGCQILVAKKGQVVFNKSYGYFTYDKDHIVENSSLYDVASVTKVAATLQAVMMLYDQGRISLDAKASQYIPEFIGTDKENILVKDILTHQAGLTSYIPYWEYTVKSRTLSPKFYARQPSENFSVQVAHNLWAVTGIEDTVWNWTVNTKLRNRPNRDGSYSYRYSDVGFYIMKEIVERQSGKPLEEFLEENIYKPLGLATMTYNPLKKHPKNTITPTELDKYFRFGLVHGFVHDQGAALIGGVGGHAGIFSNANDIAVLMQMNLQNGKYGGTRYFNETTVAKFAQRPDPDNRRGLGWDKPSPDCASHHVSYCSSGNTFGHLGFTGTCVWVDPDYDLVYVFLSNRVYPKTSNKLINQYGTRTAIHDIVYRSLNVPKEICKKCTDRS